MFTLLKFNNKIDLTQGDNYILNLIQESRKAKAEAANGNKCEQKAQECVKMLWRAFQFAFRVYTFAGGHDDRADNLTRELAHVIETIPSQN